MLVLLTSTSQILVVVLLGLVTCVEMIGSGMEE